MLNSKIARKSEQVVFQIWGWYLKKIAFSKILFCSSTKKASIWFIGQTWEMDLQCPPLILAPLVNMTKGSCENKSALFILFIFHSKNSQNSNLSLK